MPDEKPDAGAPELIEIEPAVLGQLVMTELMEYFSEPLSSGLVLLEHEALHIAGGIVQRAKGHSLTIHSRERSP
jgi:hypothetical protein